MIDKQLKLIYEYMKDAGWRWCSNIHDIPIGIKIINNYAEAHQLDSNSAWECAREIVKRDDWFSEGGFLEKIYNEYPIKDGMILFVMNPTNFFNCFAKWLEESK